MSEPKENGVQKENGKKESVLNKAKDFYGKHEKASNIGILAVSSLVCFGAGYAVGRNKKTKTDKGVAKTAK